MQFIRHMGHLSRFRRCSLRRSAFVIWYSIVKVDFNVFQVQVLPPNWFVYSPFHFHFQFEPSYMQFSCMSDSLFLLSVRFNELLHMLHCRTARFFQISQFVIPPGRFADSAANPLPPRLRAQNPFYCLLTRSPFMISRCSLPSWEYMAVLPPASFCHSSFTY